ncbi:MULTISPECIES: GNAT family N-acetyltransferase [Halorussus]|uniref:GNAT family N-acetyltransferase n=1 Tax=Halorussus TaxID=1070314 RepID=UPI0020A01DD4|nr:GNAT family N-acetyltransferase [Halorussus vallis]USZ78611.1 GNAT family N-acetyltransferase [Halorussus vallis]
MTTGTMPGLAPTAVYLREIQADDVLEAERLWVSRWGGNPPVPGEPDAWVKRAVDDDSEHVYGVVATTGEQIVGVGLCASVAHKYVRKSYYDGGYVDDLLDRHSGIMHVGIVRQGFESRGIGSRLFKNRLAWLAEYGVERVFGTSWLRNDHHDSSALFEAYGFRPVVEVEGYYGETNDRDQCPDCPGICECTARIYRRDL